VAKPTEYINPSDVLREISRKESNRAKMDQLADELWERVDGPAGLADIAKGMLKSFEGREGHTSQIRLVGELLKILIRSADNEIESGNLSREDIEAKIRALNESINNEEDE